MDVVKTRSIPSRLPTSLVNFWVASAERIISELIINSSMLSRASFKALKNCFVIGSFFHALNWLLETFTLYPLYSGKTLSYSTARRVSTGSVLVCSYEACS